MSEDLPPPTCTESPDERLDCLGADASSPPTKATPTKTVGNTTDAAYNALLILLPTNSSCTRLTSARTARATKVTISMIILDFRAVWLFYYQMCSNVEAVMSEIKKRSEIDSFARLITDWRSIAIVHAVYEHDSLRYSQIEKLLAFSPTLLSQKLAKLTESGIIVRHKATGAKEVIYAPTPLAKDIVCAYHILEGVSAKLAQAHNQDAPQAPVCKFAQETD